MQNRKQLINELRILLSRKQSREYYAKRLNISVAEINDMLDEIHGRSSEETSSTKRLNIEKGEVEISGYYPKEPTVEQIIKQHNIDLSEYTLAQFWSKQKSKGYQVSACFKAIKKDENYLQSQFIDFLYDYKPTSKVIDYEYSGLKENDSCLIINLQDAHYNKYDIKGNNDISKRFELVRSKVYKVVQETSLSSNLNKIIYIVGSDIFNSEWTSATVHNTPQMNVTDYHKGFEAICEHEISVIDFLLSSAANVEILFVPGNHDQYVGWALVKWLQAYYRNQDNLTINTDPSFTKYTKFGKSAICFNHGYKIKPEVLVQNFSIQFKDFSRCETHYCFTGDIHSEHSKMVGGVKCFRLGSISNAVSNWDDSMGYNLQKGEMTAFLIDSKDGMTRTYYEPIKY